MAVACTAPSLFAARPPAGTYRPLARPAAARRVAIKPRAAAETVSAAASTVPPSVSPAVLPGTPAPGDAFPFTADQLVALAQKVHFETENGVKDPAVLADDFRFEFPIIKFDRATYLKTVSGFTFKEGIPNLNSNAYGFQADKFEPNRVWFFVRTSGTHTGPFKFGNDTYEATGKTIQGPPELCSYTFNKEGKVTSFTGGYVVDNRVGNTKGLGAAFGILSAIGINIPTPGSLG
ncbi:hypothetical protein ABPG75_009847 [Micractinium tetrahymenae]